MDNLPIEVLIRILIKIDPSTIYNLLTVSQFFNDIIDTEQYWKIRVNQRISRNIFGHKTYKWLYKCLLHRERFRHDMKDTPWEDAQSIKEFIGDDVEGQIIYKGQNERVVEEITANLVSLRAVEEQERRFVSAGKTGYYTHLKVNNDIYFFRYAPYDTLYVGIMFENGNIFIDFSPLYVGEVTHGERGEIFRSNEGICAFRTGHTFVKNNWIDEYIFITNENPLLTIPATTINTIMVLDEGLDAWMEYCVEKNINEEWALEFSTL